MYYNRLNWIQNIIEPLWSVSLSFPETDYKGNAEIVNLRFPISIGLGFEWLLTWNNNKTFLTLPKPTFETVEWRLDIIYYICDNIIFVKFQAWQHVHIQIKVSYWNQLWCHTELLRFASESNINNWNCVSSSTLVLALPATSFLVLKPQVLRGNAQAQL